jgi:hypothetical protein
VRIAEDLGRDQLYEKATVCFAHEARDAPLERLAGFLKKSGEIGRVQRILSGNLSFVSLARNLFTFNMTGVFRTLKIEESLGKVAGEGSTIRKVALGLFSIVQALPFQPVFIFDTERGE